MPRIQYDHWDWEPRDKSVALINACASIISDYRRQGYRLTLRQLYYQLVTKNLITNRERSYKNLGNLVTKARLAGMLDWDAIEDRTRGLRGFQSWADGASYIVPDGYRSDRWAEQPTYVEVWVEKQALAGVFGAICDELEVPLFSAKGYPSISEMWRTANRLKRHRPQRLVVLHFGDHDPSGIDMTRDLVDRWRMFGVEPEVRRLALNMDQVDEYGPPPNPAKLTDSRAAEYTATHGYDSWELDALEPDVLHGLVRDEVDQLIDRDAWDQTNEDDEDQRKTLRLVQAHYEAVAEFVRDLPAIEGLD